MLNKRRRISLCDSNPVISPATAAPSPTNHQHCAVPPIPVAPEADLVPGLNVAITLGLLKPVRAAVLSAILHIAAAKTFVTGPHFSIPEVAVACEFRAERLSRQAVGCGLQQSCVAGVVAAGDLELCSLDGPEGRGDHVCVVSGICSLTNSRSSVVPILAVVLHPVLSVVVWEPGHQSPALVVVCNVAEDLRSFQIISVHIMLSQFWQHTTVCTAKRLFLPLIFLLLWWFYIRHRIVLLGWR